eukprot:2327014-Prymnesium_polylepis.1
MRCIAALAAARQPGRPIGSPGLHSPVTGASLGARTSSAAYPRSVDQSGGLIHSSCGGRGRHGRERDAPAAHQR